MATFADALASTLEHTVKVSFVSDIILMIHNLYVSIVSCVPASRYFIDH